MRTIILNTKFEFAKSINLSLIAAPDAYPDFEQGMLDFLNPYLEELSKTPLPYDLLLTSVQTIDQDEQGIHILTFTIKDPKDFAEHPEVQKLILKILEQTFAHDPEACFNFAPQINQWDSHFTVIVPYSC